MLNFIGNIINNLYNIIGNYTLVLILVGCFVSLINIYPKIVKLKGYIQREKLNPQVEEIKKKNLPKDQEEMEIGELFQSQNYNPILVNLPNFIFGILSIMLFMVVLSPDIYIGIPKNFSESFWYYDNIFEKSFDIIMPLLTAIIQTISPLLGQPLQIIDKKQTITNFVVSVIMYLVFGSIICHLYIIYCFGLAIGNIITDTILIYPRRKKFNIETYKAKE